MNIYLLNATETAWLPAHLLCGQLPIKGLIGLADTEANRAYGEYCDYSDFCATHGIEHVALNSYNMSDAADKETLLALDIDIVLSVSWQRLVPEWFIRHCTVGVVGSHGSPGGITAGRGRSPQNWALLLGCPQFSYSIFWIDPGIDSGHIIDTMEFAYSECDDIMTSYIKAGLAMAEMMVKNYQNGRLQAHAGTPQPAEGGYYLPQRTAGDGRIDWHLPARRLYDFVRALTRPYPGAFTTLGDAIVRVWACKYIESEAAAFAGGTPGEVVLAYPGGELLVRCGEGLLLLTDYTCEGALPKAGDVFASANFAGQLQAIVNRHYAKYNFPVSPLITGRLHPGSDGDTP